MVSSRRKMGGTIQKPMAGDRMRPVAPMVALGAWTKEESPIEPKVEVTDTDDRFKLDFRRGFFPLIDFRRQLLFEKVEGFLASWLVKH